MNRFTIYLVTNKKSGKRYVGCTAYPLPVRWGQHVWRAVQGRPGALAEAIRQDGWQLFTIEPIEYVEDPAWAILRERHWINSFETENTEFGYNRTSKEYLSALSRRRWTGRKHSEKTKLKIGQASANRSAATLQKLREAGTRNYLKSIGKRKYGPLSEEHKKKLSDAQLRRKLA